MTKEKKENSELIPVAPVVAEAPAVFEAITGLDGLSADDLGAGIDLGYSGYYKQYPLNAYMDAGQFVIRRNAERLTDCNEFTAIMLYLHTRYSLSKADIDRIPYDQQTDEDRMPLAISYSSPFSKLNPSRGNFDTAGYGRYLDDKSLRDLVTKKQYIIALLPDISKTEPAIISLGKSALIPASNYVLSIKQRGMHPAMAKTTIGSKREKTEKGISYHQVTFTEAGNAVKTGEQYKKFMLPLIRNAEELHRDAIKNAESRIIFRDAYSTTITSTATVVPDVNDDEMPF
jgi:hypothetical protein